MKIEILFPEICDLYGDSGNVLYLEKNFPKDTVIKTSFLETPYFVNNNVGLIYLGPMSENNFIKVLNKLKPYKKRIKELISQNVVFLFTGNACEIMGKTIQIDNKDILKGLNLINVETIFNKDNRYNSLFLGDFSDEDHPIVGYKSQNDILIVNDAPLFKVTKEKNNAQFEGVRKNNFFGTNLLGPILILNPYFTKYLFSLLGFNEPIYLEEELISAYNRRLKEYQIENIKL